MLETCLEGLRHGKSLSSATDDKTSGSHITNYLMKEINFRQLCTLEQYALGFE